MESCDHAVASVNDRYLLQSEVDAEGQRIRLAIEKWANDPENEPQPAVSLFVDRRNLPDNATLARSAYAMFEFCPKCGRKSRTVSVVPLRPLGYHDAEGDVQSRIIMYPDLNCILSLCKSVAADSITATVVGDPP